jgi:orotidine-5'-phosphate decarboxylase
MTRQSPICVAIDTPDLERAAQLAHALAPHAGYAKVGMEFFYAHGTRGYEAVAKSGLPVFLDLKLHDIPNTVASAMKALMRLEPVPAIINVHASGGADMMTAAADAVAGRIKLIAVTVLTSLSNEDVKTSGFAMDTQSLAAHLAGLAKKSGLDGVVCSPLDLAQIRHECGKDFLTVVPGIRPASTEPGDQRRVATPAAALKAGADLLVIGRPITGAADPAAAAQAILAELGDG